MEQDAPDLSCSLGLAAGLINWKILKSEKREREREREWVARVREEEKGVWFVRTEASVRHFGGIKCKTKQQRVHRLEVMLS